MPDMIPGKLADYQRDVAWYGKDTNERQATTAYKPSQNSEIAKPESAEKRQEREDLDYARLDGGDAERGRQARGAGAARQAAEMAEDKKKRDKEAVDRAELMSAANRLSSYEDYLADNYGEDFADNLFADLNQDGLISEDDYKDIMSISDIEERRRAQAAYIQKMLDEGKITIDDLKDHPWAKKWLDLDKQATIETQREAQMVREGKADLDEVGVAAQDLLKEDAAADRSLNASDAENASVNEFQNNDLNDIGKGALGGMGLGGL